MPISLQLKYNGLACIKDIKQGNFQKLKFHLAGVKRAIWEMFKPAKKKI